MGIRVDWDDEGQTMLRYTVSGQWAWEEFNAALSQARQMADGTDTAQIDSIIDIRDGSLFPQNVLLRVRQMPTNAHPKLKAGTVVLIGGGTFVKTLMEIMRHINPQAMANFHDAPTLDAARRIVLSVREQVVAK